MKIITVQELRQELATGKAMELIDVRPSAEYRRAHVPGARNISLTALEKRKSAGEGTIYLLCHSGTCARKAAQQLAGAGFENSIVIEGGTQAWADAGYPVEKSGRRALPIERQLFLFFGPLILAGALLAWYVNPNWIWLPAFFGAGQTIVGLTGFCPMRRVLGAVNEF